MTRTRKQRASCLRHGAERYQDGCIGFIEEYYIFKDPNISVRQVAILCNKEYPNIPSNTIRNWWNHFLQHGEAPYETKAERERLSKRLRGFKTATNAEDNRVVIAIQEENPEYYINEFVKEFGMQTGKNISYNAVRHILKHHGLSLQVC